MIGIAGGVGSGKSTVLEILKNEYDAVICMADQLGHEVMKKGTSGYDQVVNLFGKDIVAPGGEINREALAGLVYGQPAQLEELNRIIHPLVLEEISRRIKEHDSERLFILETALLFETGCDRFCSEVWGVVTDDEIRIQRLSENRGYTREKSLSIMKNQFSNQKIKEMCRLILENNGDLDRLRQQIRSAVENFVENKSGL